MYSQIVSQFRRRGELLMAGRMEELVAGYLFPLPIFLRSSRLVLQEEQDAKALLGALRQGLMRRGVVALRPQVTAVDLPRGGRFRVWLDWHELPGSTANQRSSSAIYYCSPKRLGSQIEMVNYLNLSMPDLDRQGATLAEPA